ncbi:hypothetical protein B0H17DRAFT_1133253 [Mycena rosella]|uniref:Uncharacterized protein n=1 Tax=Mycena rosella TaxID=1033263 RepID=A0AAD7GFH7_MYCRO|nr:hypothetical protein B0H17DRAFT_1133253 [Mycena rosella]
MTLQCTGNAGMRKHVEIGRRIRVVARDGEDVADKPQMEFVGKRCTTGGVGRERRERGTPELPCVFRIPGRRRGGLGLDVAGCVTYALPTRVAAVALSAVTTVEGGRCRRRGRWKTTAAAVAQVTGGACRIGGARQAEASSGEGSCLWGGRRRGLIHARWGTGGAGAAHAEGARRRGVERVGVVQGQECYSGRSRGWYGVWRGQEAVTIAQHGEGVLASLARRRWWSRGMSCATFEGGGDRAGDGRRERQRGVAVQSTALQTIIREAQDDVSRRPRTQTHERGGIMTALRVSIRKRKRESEEERGEGEDRYIERRKGRRKRRVKRSATKKHLDRTKRVSRGGSSAHAIAAELRRAGVGTAQRKGKDRPWKREDKEADEKAKAWQDGRDWAHRRLVFDTQY